LTGWGSIFGERKGSKRKRASENGVAQKIREVGVLRPNQGPLAGRGNLGESKKVGRKRWRDVPIERKRRGDHKKPKKNDPMKRRWGESEDRNRSPQEIGSVRLVERV